MHACIYVYIYIYIYIKFCVYAMRADTRCSAQCLMQRSVFLNSLGESAAYRVDVNIIYTCMRAYA